MLFMQPRQAASLTLSAVLVSLLVVPPVAEARGGRAGGRAGSYAGARGGSFRYAGAGAVGSSAGLVGGGFKGTTARGGSGWGAGAAGWRKGVGGFEATGMQLQGAGGSTYKGWTKGHYNAKTGQGVYDSSRQVYNAKNGNNYGYTQDTNFTKGQGGTTSLDTVNHGDYTVDWQKGQKPVVTPTGQ